MLYLVCVVRFFSALAGLSGCNADFCWCSTHSEGEVNEMKRTIGIMLALILCAGFMAAAESDPLAGAADWAIPELEKAMENNLVRYDMIGNWAQPADRLLAAESIAFLVEDIMRTDTTFVADQMEFDRTDVFSDTDNERVNFLKQAGISDGVGGGRFSPEGIFTRAQMVTMLGRMAKNIFGIDMAGFPKGSTQFTDIPAWADEYIGWAIAAGVTDGVGGGRFDSNGALQNQHVGVFAYRAFVYFDALKHATLRTGELRRTGEYVTVEQMEKLKTDALSWQSAVAGMGAFAEIVAIEPADGSGQQVYFAFRRFDQAIGGHVVYDEGYERLQIMAPTGVQARIIYVTEGAGSGELNIGYRFMSGDSEWIENFFAVTLEDFAENGRWENTTEFMHQLYLRGLPSYLRPF